ncbi:MAG: hypothetical protein ACR2LL_02400 [Nitrosopumilus sp.]|uniref:hypothetical protein n=1 Tax=Nitrosopumilus sp. TaxID=2024843 RepID=UPI00292E4273|nr:hypothetical protein [Nitrosopumilus sp.]
MLYVQSVKPHKSGFARSESNTYSAMSQTETMEELCEEIQLLAKDSRNFEQQYDSVLKYYRTLTSER